MITPILKDRVLNYLVQNAPVGQLVFAPTNEFLKATELEDIIKLRAILQQFERLGLLERSGVGATSVEAIVNVDAHDFVLRGGFTAKEEHFEKSIEKLLYEIDHLKNQLTPSQLETANKISGIAQGIAAGLQIITALK